MREKVYEVVSINDTMSPIYTFSNEIAAKGFIKKYLGDSKKYVVQPRERQEVYSSVVDFETSKKREISDLESKIKNLNIGLPFDIYINQLRGKAVKITSRLSYEYAKKIKFYELSNGNAYAVLPNKDNFIVSLKIMEYIKKETEVLATHKAKLE